MDKVTKQFIDDNLEIQVLSVLSAAGEEKFYELIDLLPLAAFPTHLAEYQALVDGAPYAPPLV